ncbi:MAG: MBL fold metallo-hydrolase [Clostridia bacterium]|nr:MBL fold metallo-hydrolase [Clostridia bacterium]
MYMTWLGQAGLFIEIGDKKIMIDPYLSDSVGKVNPEKHRRMPVDESYLHMDIDALVCTHNHLDHVDPESVEPILKQEKEIAVLAPWDGWQALRKYGGNHNYVLFNRHTEWTLADGVRLTAVKAEHSDLSAIGVLIEAEGKTLYITGDTLYNTEIFADLPKKIDYIFVPVNGMGNNMNAVDAKRFAEKCGAKTVVPLHWGMLDDFTADIYPWEKMELTIYKREEL